LEKEGLEGEGLLRERLREVLKGFVLA